MVFAASVATNDPSGGSGGGPSVGRFEGAAGVDGVDGEGGAHAQQRPTTTTPTTTRKNERHRREERTAVTQTSPGSLHGTAADPA
jgi:hypothetical protein